MTVKSESRSQSRSKTRSRSDSRSRSKSNVSQRSYESNNSRNRKTSRDYSEDNHNRSSASRSPHDDAHDSRNNFNNHNNDDDNYGRRHRNHYSSNSNSNNYGNRREQSEPSECLGVFNLPPKADERDLEHIFGHPRFGKIKDIKVIRDHYTGDSKCFGFVYYEKLRDAIKAKEELNNSEMFDKIIRVDFSYSYQRNNNNNNNRRSRRRSRSENSGYRYSRSRSPVYNDNNDRRQRRRSRSNDSLSFSRSRSLSGERRMMNRNRSRSRSMRRVSPNRNRRSRSRSRRRDNRSPRFHPENPNPNRCLGVFNLNKSTSEEKLRSIFRKFGRVNSIKIITNHETNKSKGYAFIYFDEIQSAIDACYKMNQQEIHGNIIRVDFSKTNVRGYNNDYDNYGGGNETRRRRSISRSPRRSSYDNDRHYRH